jgi:hypothetical protein
MNKEERLKNRLDRCQTLEKMGYTYDHITGKIFGARKKEIKRKDWNGYVHIYHTNPNFNLAGHHFAWYIMNRTVDYEQIDHINGVRDDNKIENLRVATNQTNSFNRRKVVGYTWSKEKKKWLARIKLNDKTHHLGYFDNQFDARQAYLKAKKKLHII